MTANETLPELLLRNARRHPGRDAVREKEFGIWQVYTWHEYAEQVRRFALGLAAMGFGRGDRLAVIGDNRPRLYFAMLAAQSLGGISMALYQDSIAREMGYVLSHAEVRVIVAEDEEQVDKLYEIREELPHVERVVFDDPRGLELKPDPWLVHYADVQREGDRFAQAHPDYFGREVEQGRADDVALFCYTSGTTGVPKGVMLTHENVIVNIVDVMNVEGWSHRDDAMAYLPMAWIGDFVLNVCGGLVTGMCINIPESPATVTRDYREVGPTIIFGPPRNWENLITRIQVRMEEADRLKRTLYHWFMAVAIRVERLRRAGHNVPLRLRLLNALGERLIRAPLRDLIGAARVRKAYTGGAPLGPDVFDFFRALGVNLKQLYGLTESSAACIFQPDGEASGDTVGRPLPGVEVKVAENGEILLRGRMNFKGYYKDEEGSRRTVDGEGWLATGDAGFIDRNGHLKVIDRAKDVSRLRDGTLFAPQYLENKLKFSPYVKEAVTLGSGRDFVTAMICVDPDSLQNWAERRGLAYTGYQDLSQKPEVYQLIHDEIARINSDLAQDPELAGARIRRFLILYKELDPDDGEITRTRKIRRGVIGERYAAFIDALYSEQQEVQTDIAVTYEDGRTGQIRAAVAIRDVAPPESAAVRPSRLSA